MASVNQIIVEVGPEKGKTISVPADGVRVGRSSKNDVVLSDPLLSRHHCRIYLKPNDGLWVSDLGSANSTLVNDKMIQDVPLAVGDRITIGNTILRVLADGRAGAKVPAAAAPAPAAAPAAAPAPESGAGAVVDLGLSSPEAVERKEREIRKPMMGLYLTVAALVAAVAIGLLAVKLMKPKPKPRGMTVPDQTLSVDYEKVEGTSANIFRYCLQINTNSEISVQIDDLQQDRRVREGPKKMDADYVKTLVRAFQDSEFFGLSEEYQGVQPDVMDQRDITITIGKKTHSVRVLNRPEPDAFRLVREKLEECGKNELGGLGAIQYSREKLVEMARDTYLAGKRLLDEREVKPGNLYAGLKNFREAEIYLETLEPKPDFYADLLTCKTDGKKALDDKFNDQLFRAQRAVKLREWEEAARELRVLCEIIPDREDSRNKEAMKNLIDVENRLEKKK